MIKMNKEQQRFIYRAFSGLWVVSLVLIIFALTIFYVCGVDVETSAIPFFTGMGTLAISLCVNACYSDKQLR